MSKILKGILVALASAVVTELAKLLEPHKTSSFLDGSLNQE